MAHPRGSYNATFSIPAPNEMSEVRACRYRYSRLRRHTFELVEEEYLRATRLRIDVNSIDDDALRIIRDEWSKHPRRADFDWEGEILPTIRKSHPRAIDIAIWCGGVLCGVAVARLSDSKQWLSLTYLEGSPVPERPLKKQVTPVVITALDIYSSLVHLHDAAQRRPSVRIMRPLPEVLSNYQSIGYDVIHRGKGDGKKYAYIVARD